MLKMYDISIQLQVKCQACFALRNLASDGRYICLQKVYYRYELQRYSAELKISYGGYFTDENQLLAVDTGALPPLHHILTSCRSETLAAAAACLRNLSIHKLNEVCFLSM